MAKRKLYLPVMIAAALAVLALSLVGAPAAMAQTASVEGESFTHPRGTAVVHDQIYSGGAALKFKKSKAVATKQVTITETSTVVVRARAGQKKGSPPALTLRVDGQDAGTLPITSTTLADYSYDITTLEPGTYTIGLKGENIAKNRNVFVDVVTFPTGGSPPPPADTTPPDTIWTGGLEDGKSYSCCGYPEYYPYKWDGGARVFAKSSESNSTYQCYVQQGNDPAPFSWNTCTENDFYLGHEGEVSQGVAPLYPGYTTSYFRAIDAAGNVDPTPLKVTVERDEQGGNTQITSGPKNGEFKPPAEYSWEFQSEPNSTFECRLIVRDQFGNVNSSLSQLNFQACTSPYTHDFSSYDGQYQITFEVRSRDSLGNLGAEAREGFQIDTTQ
jgi:hypothetical protein